MFEEIFEAEIRFCDYDISFGFNLNPHPLKINIT